MLVLLVVLGILGSSVALDPRNITSGITITNATGGYFDQPQIVFCGPDNVWVAVMTANEHGTEGAAGEHISSSRSTDNGTTWSPLLDIEPPSSIAASYASTLITPKGRIYTIYTYNADNITTLPNGQKLSRTDELGHFKLKYSDDCGLSWSEDRYEVPFPETSIDYHNNWNGTVKMFWVVDKPIIVGESVYVAFTKIGAYIQGPPCEVFFLTSSNLLNATDPSTITWDLLPHADVGLISPAGPGVSEEPHIVMLDSPEHFWVTYRTDRGYLGGGYSLNSGLNWTSMWTTYEGGVFGRPLKNPRAPITPARFSNGLYLLLFFNNNPTSDWIGRNPYWLTGGRLVNGSIPSIQWAQPEIILYSTGTLGFAGYPDIVEFGGNYYITETDKGGPVSSIRVSQIDPNILNYLWNQWEVNQIVDDYVLDVDIPTPGSKVTAPSLPDLSTGGGFSILFWIALSPTFAQNATIFDTRANSSSSGIWISTGWLSVPTIGITINDGTNSAYLYTDPTCSSVLLDSQLHHIGFIVDGGSKVISVVVDGILCDGGAVSGAGWVFFPIPTTQVSGSGSIIVGEGAKIQNLKIYDRYLLTSEVISNWRAGEQ